MTQWTISHHIFSSEKMAVFSTKHVWDWD